MRKGVYKPGNLTNPYKAMTPKLLTAYHCLNCSRTRQTDFLGNPDLKLRRFSPKAEAVFLLFKLLAKKQTSHVARHNFLPVVSITEMRENESCSDITKHRSELAVMEVVGSINTFTILSKMAW